MYNMDQDLQGSKELIINSRITICGIMSSPEDNQTKMGQGGRGGSHVKPLQQL